MDQNGQKRSKHAVIVETMQMLDSKNDASSHNNNNYAGANPASGGESYNSSYGDTNRQQNAQPSKKPMPEANIPEIDIDEDEIPF